MTRATGLALALCAWMLGCKAIVGIEDRHYDEITKGDGGSKAGTSGGGKSGTGGGGGGDGDGDGGDVRKDGGADAGTNDAGSTPEDAGSDGGQPPADSGGADAGQDAMTPPGPTACEQYCTAALANCNDEYEIYPSMQACMALCAHLPEGDLSANNPTGNTVACRLDQAKLAEVTGEPWDHCPRAGPGGAGVCGDNCESYCLLFSKACPDDADANCLAKCPALRDLDDEPRAFDDSTFDVIKHHDGDFLQCRLVHVTNASIAPIQHCWHAALAPRKNPDPKVTEANPCADGAATTPRCEDYCRLNVGICTGNVTQYESNAQCLKVCAALDKGTSGDAGGQNTVGCRKNHSYNALLGGVDTHCPHSGPGGHNVCGSNCDSYCKEVAAACPAQFEGKFADNAACLAECGGLPERDAPYTVNLGKAGTNKLACRMLHTARAFTTASECTAALGGGVCQ